MQPARWILFSLFVLLIAAIAVPDGSAAAEDPHQRVIKKKAKNRKEVRRDNSNNRRTPEQTDQARTFSRVEPLSSVPGVSAVGGTKQHHPEPLFKKKRGGPDDDLGHTRADLGKGRRGAANAASGGGGKKAAAADTGGCPACPAPHRTRLKVRLWANLEVALCAPASADIQACRPVSDPCRRPSAASGEGSCGSRTAARAKSLA